MKILVLNSGGSSVKFQVIEMPAEKTIASGGIERIGKQDAIFKFSGANHEQKKKVLPAANHKEAIEIILESLIAPENGVIAHVKEIEAVGHRVVHGGEELRESRMINEDVIAVIDVFADKAPLHNPPNLMGIRICQALMGKTPQVAVFDHALHKDIPDYAYIYGLPYKYYEKYGVRKFGFHGITFQYMTTRACEIIGQPADKLKIVSLMLGSGCTANAMKYGKSIDVSTGFTPFEGLIQSTRCGDVDTTAALYIMKKEGLTPQEMEDVLNRESGWYGISGVSNDLREIMDATDNSYRSRLAVEAFAYRARKYVGAYAAAMSGIDLLVFSGGVGENVPVIRSKICTELAFLGLEIDEGKNINVNKEGLISKNSSKTGIAVVKTDEELVIARETYAVVVS